MIWKLTIRSLARNPGFTAAVVLTLALGIGANTAIFTVADRVALRSLPYRDSGRLVAVWDQLNNLGLTRFSVTHAHYLDYRQLNAVFEDIAAFDFFDANLTADQGDAERVTAMRVTANLFPMTGATVSLGRVFSVSDPDNSVLLSNGLWRRRFGSDPLVIGRSIKVNDSLYQIAGVLPAGFRWPIATATEPDLWTPLVVRPDPERRRGGLRLIARMKPGVSREQAEADMKRVAGRLQVYRPYRGPRGEDPGYSVTVVGLREQIYGSLPRTVLVLLGAVALVMAIACTNVAHLLLARGAARSREIAVSRALGATGAAILKRLLAESVLLSLGGCVAGLLLAQWALQFFSSIAPESLLRDGSIAIDFRVLVFGIGLSLATSVIFALVPVIHNRGIDLTEALKSARSTARPAARRSAGVLIAGQVALSLMLLVSAGLLMRSFLHLLQVNPGFRPDNVLSLRISLPLNRYSEPHRRAAFFGDLLARVERLPSVESAGIVSRLPLSGVGPGGDPFSIEGRAWRADGPVPQFTNHQAASPQYFRTMGIPLLKGRMFTASDTGAGEHVALINETLARGFFPNDDPIGRRILIGAPRPGAPWLTIIGVVGDVHNSGLDIKPIPQTYEPYAQQPIWSVWLAARGPADPMALLDPIRKEVAAVDRDQPVYDVRTMADRVSSAVSQPRFQGVLMLAFSAIALALASIGLYGVTSHSVARRTQEIGVRMSLGARPGDIIRLIVAEGMRPVFLGCVIGAAGVWAAARMLKAVIFVVGSVDPITLVGIVTVLTLIALIACWLPARRAARVDPASTLRES